MNEISIGQERNDPHPIGRRDHAELRAPDILTPAAILADGLSSYLGIVVDVTGAGAKLLLRADAITALSNIVTDPFLAMAGQVGSQTKIWTGARWVFGVIRSMSRQGQESEALLAEIDFTGECDADGQTGIMGRYARGVTHYPSPGRRVFAASAADAALIYANNGQASVRIGTVYPSSQVEGCLQINPLLSQHFAIVGSTGTGKSTAVALILHRICNLAPQGHIVMMDPHGEYSAAFRNEGEVFDTSNLRLPYWLMNLEEHCEIWLTSAGAERNIDRDILARCVQAARRKSPIGKDSLRITADTPIPYMLSDLSAILQAEMGRLDKASDTIPYLRLKNRIDEVKSDPRYGFMFSGMLVADTMHDVISRIFRLPARGKPISIVDLSAVPSDVTAVVVAMLSRLILDYAVWSRGTGESPILLVCEEAHRYIPSEAQVDGNSVGKILCRIAKEGRKYGVSLGLVTQRPSDLAEGVLSQCGTIMTMRLGNERDQAFVRAAMPEGGKSLLDALPALRNRECIVSGEGVAAPLRILIDELEETKRPNSGDPVFTDLWQCGGDERPTIDHIIRKWRGQTG